MDLSYLASFAQDYGDNIDEETPDVQPEGGEQGSPEVAGQGENQQPVDENGLPTFDNDQQAAEYWRQQALGIQEMLNSEEFVKSFLDKYGAHIAEQEREIEAFKDHLKAFKTNPQEYLKQYFPEYWDAIGLPPVLTDEQIGSAIEETLAQEFGEHWQDVYDQKEALRRGSFSAKVQARYAQLSQQYDEQNRQAEKKRLEYTQKLSQTQPQQQIDPQVQLEEYASELERQYEEHLKPLGVTEDQFMEFFESMNGKQLTVADLWRLNNMEAEIKKAREEAYQEGRRSLKTDLSKAGKAVPYKAEKSPTVPKAEGDADEYYRKLARPGYFV